MSEKTNKKIDNILSFGSFLMVILIGFYYGFNWSLPAAFASAFASAAYRRVDHPTLFDSIKSLSTAYLALLVVGVINKTMIPIAIVGLTANILGYYMHRLGKAASALVVVVGTVLAFVAAATVFPEYMRNSLSDSYERPVGKILLEDQELNKYRSFEGDIVIVNFWASWCGPCRNEMKEFQELYDQYKDHPRVGMYFINADPRESWADIEKFKASTGFDLAFYDDVRGLTSQDFKVDSYPTTLIIKDDRIVWKHTGYMKGEQIGAFLQHEIEDELNR